MPDIFQIRRCLSGMNARPALFPNGVIPAQAGILVGIQQFLNKQTIA